MDPANESLQQALRLSYRLLQGAMLALVAVFLLSGFQQVQEGETGVRTLFGAVGGEPGTQALEPGLQPYWPYPVGELHLVPLRVGIDLRSEFFPRLSSEAITLEEASATADVSQALRPGVDGFVVTADGDVAHLRLHAECTVVDPVALLERIDPRKVANIFSVVLERATVLAASELTLSQLLESRDEFGATIRDSAQQSLDRLQLGVQVSAVTVSDRSAPLAVRNQISGVQARRENARVSVERARQEANSTLVGAAGPPYAELLKMISQYEALLTAGQTAEAEGQLRAIGARLEQPDIGGEAARIMARARAYSGAIESTLGKEVRRLQSLAPAFRENPRQLVRQLWLQTIREVISDKQVEIFSMPANLSRMDITVESSPDVVQIRRDAELARKKREAEMLGAGDPAFQLGSREIVIDREGRRLDKTGTKGAGRE